MRAPLGSAAVGAPVRADARTDEFVPDRPLDGRTDLLATGDVGWYPFRMEILEDVTIDAALTGLTGWRRGGDAILRDLRFPTFMDAIRFIDRVAVVAEECDHHPELTNVYWNVGIRLTTHDAGGVTDRDLQLARAIDAVVDGGE